MKKVKNYLNNVEEVTAPLNWKSSPDSPSTQLAYITKPEVDLLVKANLHGSMKGKPNVGPQGIMSLDGLAEEDAAYDQAVDMTGNEAAIDSYFSSGQYQSDQNQGNTNNTASNIIQNVQNYTGEDIFENKSTSQGKAYVQEEEEEEEEKKPNALQKFLIDTVTAGKDFITEYSDFGGFGGLLMTPFKLLAEPTVETFQNPQALTQLALLFEKNKDNPKFKEQYLSDHGDLLKEALGGDIGLEPGSSEYADKNQFSSIEEAFDAKLEKALGDAKMGLLGQHAQYSSDPTAFYDANPNLNQTTTQLMDLAKLDASKYPGLADKIFAARAELDRMGKNPLTGNPQQGGSGISSAYNQGDGNSGSGSGSATTDTTQDFAMPDLGTADIVYPDAQETVDTYASNSPLQNLLTGALNAKDGGIINAADGVFAQVEITKKPNLPLTLGEIKEAKKKYEGYQYDIEVDGKTRSYNFDEKLAPSGIETLRKREGITPFDTGLNMYGGGQFAEGNTPEARRALEVLKSIDPNQPGHFHMQGGTALNYKNMGGMMNQNEVDLAPNFDAGI